MKSRLTLNVIPEQIMSWFVSSRQRFMNDLRQGKPLKYFSAHLPVMATWNHHNPFPVNMTVKGIGLIPRTEYLEDYIDIFEGTLAESRALTWHESLSIRIDAMNRLYNEVEVFEPTLLGGLEIFEGKAFENLQENAYTSLLYVGMSHTEDGIQYISFQVNGQVEILEKDSLSYRFLLASRKLFEFDKFHLYQPDYPFGYLINVMEVRDKSPWTRKNESQ
jgi:hypothetical protein